MGLFSAQLPATTMVLMCRQLATSYGAGIPILRSLALVGQNVQDHDAQKVLRRMHDSIRDGDTLSQAARKQSAYLPPMFVELIQSGEIGGRLDMMLRDLASYYEDRLRMRREIVRRLTYPFLQLVAAWFLGTFSLQLIKLVGTEDFNLSVFLNSYARFQGAAFVLAVAVFLLALLLSRAGLLKWIWGWAATYLWPIASVTRRFATARFFRSLSFLIGSGMPVTRAVEGAAATAINPYIERDLLTAVPRIKSGMTLSEAFAPCKFFTNEMREMLLVGEESGKHEEALRKASDYQMEEAMQAVAIATRVGEVAIILLVSCIIGYIVIKFWSTYFGKIDELTR